MVLSGTVLANNVANTGGAVFVSDPTAVRIACDRDGETQRTAFSTTKELDRMPSMDTLDNVCRYWRRNAAKEYGREIATYARGIRWHVESKQRGGKSFLEEIHGFNHSVSRHRSGEQLPKIHLRVVDAFGQGPVVGFNSSAIRCQLRSWPAENGLIPGNISLFLDEGEGEFSNVMVFQEPGIYVIRIDFSEGGLPSLFLDVAVRPCIIGEASVRDNLVCVQCSDTQYTFDTSQSECKTCPDNADCSPPNVIHPKRHYWHRHPCSTYMQECINQDACDFDNREQNLAEITEEMEDCRRNVSMDNAYADAQCKEVSMLHPLQHRGIVDIGPHRTTVRCLQRWLRPHVSIQLRTLQ